LPLPRKSLVAKCVAQKYNLGYIDPENEILQWESDQWAVLNSDEVELKNISNQVIHLK
jgi:hypothetical protein